MFDGNSSFAGDDGNRKSRFWTTSRVARRRRQEQAVVGGLRVECDKCGGLVVGTAATLGGVLQKGCFVMWQMVPNNWLIEVVVGGHKVVAGSDGNVAWRHTPWLGSHAANGSLRPLRRALQGLDPVAISSVFSTAQYIGEKHISGIGCFVLKLSANQTDLADRSDSTAEMIKHVVLGYFSQRSGLLVHVEDSYLTRIQSPGNQPAYWDTTMATNIEDSRTVEGVMIAHSGQSSVIITRFGDNLKEAFQSRGWRRFGPSTTLHLTWPVYHWIASSLLQKSCRKLATG